jgi:HK97 gp10 family phage protein
MVPTVKVTGIQGLRTALNRLPVELQRATAAKALREGMKPVLKAARANAGKSKDSGLLQKSLGLNVRKGKNGLTARVGPRSGFKKMVHRKGKGMELANPVKYAHLVEYGTSHSAAKPFIRPAIDSSTEAINTKLAEGYEKGLTQAVNKVKSR